MTASAFKPTAPLGIAILTLSSLMVCSLILVGNVPAAPRLWVFLGIVGIALLSVWRLSRAAGVSPLLFDQGAWIILISHPVLVSRVRDTRILVQDQSLSAEIAIEIGIWCVLSLYSVARLLGNLHKIRDLWGPSGRYATFFLLVAIVSAAYAASPIITLAWCLKLLTIVLLSCLMFDPYDAQASCSRFVSASYWGLGIIVSEFIVLAALSPESAITRSDSTGILRLGGYLVPSTQLSAIAGMVGLLALVDILAGKRSRFTLVILTISGGLMFASLGRGGMLATAAAMTLALAAFRRIRMAACLVLTSCMIFAAVPDIVDVSWQILSRRQTGDQILGLTGRVHLWQASIELIAEKPLLGWGYVSGSRIALLTSFRGWAAPHAHNAYLEALLTLGLVGAAILLLLLSSTFSRLITHLRLRWSFTRPDDCCLNVLKILLLVVVVAIEGLFTPGFSGAPYWATSLLIGAAFFSDSLSIGWMERQGEQES